MSSRQLRKLQQQRERARSQDQNSNASDNESDEESYLPAPKQSLFANLAALEEDVDDDEDDNSGSEAVHSNVEDSRKPEAVTTNAPKKSKKSKKKKKAKQVPAPQIDNTRHEGDDIDAALAELKIKNSKNGYVEAASPALNPEYERVCQLLGINSQHLKVANEMKNLFGRAAIENNDDAGGAVPGRRGRRNQPQQVDLETALKGHHLPGKGLPELSLRRNIFIQGKDDWPRGTTGGLTMEVVDDKSADGTVEYRFVHDHAYNTIQRQFDMFVEMGEPNNLIGLLQRNPYHISLLLQVSKVAKNQSDHALSNDLVERALFTFARASLSSFSGKLSQGKARLDFARPENRELWLAGFQYIRSLVMKGTYRTALEWAKLLYSLDPRNDPYSMTLMIHHLALRAHEFEWLLEFGDTDSFNKNPIAAFTKPSLAFASMRLKQGVKCRETLSDCVQHMPWLFAKLFQELNLSDPPPSIWGMLPETEPQILLTELYIRQTKDLWNAPEATSLLVEVAHSTDKLSKPESTILDKAKITLDVARFVYLDDTPALMALVPSRLMHRSNNSDSDPLPPDTNLCSWPNQEALFTRSSTSSGMEGYNNPLEAIRRMLPFGRPGNNAVLEEEPQDEEALREQIGQVFDADTTERALESLRVDGQPAEGPGLLRRAIDSIFSMAGYGGAQQNEHNPDSDDEEPVEELPYQRPPGSFD